MNREERFEKDIQRIQSLPIVPSILELICRTTGMGFSAVARVTEKRWIACAVRDEINFGLKPGGELEVETTICNEIRGHRQPVVIDDVLNDDQFCNHHTPKQYGFRSYISIPIILKDGTFFGTLCAIDPKPFPLKSSNMVTMFNLYADLISYHLLTQDQIQAKNELLQLADSKLQDSLDDIRQYSTISRHTLQEPLRKLQIFSDLLITESTLAENHNVKLLAGKINIIAKDFSVIINQLSDYSEMTNLPAYFRPVNLNEVLNLVIDELKLKINRKNAVIDSEVLPVIPGSPQQITQLFYYVLDNALHYTQDGIAPVIKIYSGNITSQEVKEIKQLDSQFTYCKVCIEDNGIGMESDHLHKIFDLFSRLNSKQQFEGIGMGLSRAKKIIRNHGGTIMVQSKPGAGSLFSLLFRVQQAAVGLQASAI